MPHIDPVFAIAALVTLGAGTLVVTLRNPVHSAISMLVAFLGLAVIFLKLHAPFLAAIHVLVYTGAILVLFLFVIMLLNLQPRELGEEHSRPAKGLAIGVAARLAPPLAAVFPNSAPDGAPLQHVQ